MTNAKGNKENGQRTHAGSIALFSAELACSQGILLPNTKRINVKLLSVLIGIRDAKLQSLLNDHGRLEAKFGAPLAKLIATRMGLLKAAPRLDFVPHLAPICLSLVDGASETFSVSLGGSQLLLFKACAQIVRKDGALNLASVNEIEIQGFALAQAKATPNLKAAQ